MKLVGNFKDWIRPEWIEFMENNQGMAHPKNKEGPYGVNKAVEFGYSKNQMPLWTTYGVDDFAADLGITPVPIDADYDDWDGWFCKLEPGQCIPAHDDGYDNHIEKTCITTRFWMPLQDYVTGHGWVHGDTFYNNYKAGDLYQQDGSVHFAFNATNTKQVRYTFNFWIYKYV